LCRKHGISDATSYKWRTKYGGIEVSEAKKLKRLPAESVMDNATLKEMLTKNFWRLVQERLPWIGR
jgi:putative transposase